MKRFNDDRYKEGVDTFLNYAVLGLIRSVSSMMHCPCTNCRNKNMLDQSFLRQYLLCCHFDKDYMCRNHHGEGTTDKVEDIVPLGAKLMAQKIMRDLQLAAQIIMRVLFWMNFWPKNVAKSNDLASSSFRPDDPMSFWDVDKRIRLLYENKKELCDGCKEFT